MSKEKAIDYGKKILRFSTILLQKLNTFLIFSFIPIIIALIMFYVSKKFNDGIKQVKTAESELNSKSSDLSKKLEEGNTYKKNFLTILNTLPSMVDTSNLRNGLDNIFTSLEEGKRSIKEVIKGLRNVLNVVKKILSISSNFYYYFGMFFVIVGILALLIILFSKYR